MQNLRKNLNKTFVVLVAILGVFMFAACKKENSPETPKVNINGFTVESMSTQFSDENYIVTICLTNNNSDSGWFYFSNIVILDDESNTYQHNGGDRYFSAGQYIEFGFTINNVSNLSIGDTLTIKYVENGEGQNIDVVLGTVIIQEN